MDRVYIKLIDRAVLFLGGKDAKRFLHSIASNTVREGLVYNTILSPQGRILTDFFACPYQDGYLLDCAASFVAGFVALLKKYALASGVVIKELQDLAVYGFSFPAGGALIFPDPRHSAMGHRGYAALKDAAWSGARAGLLADYERNRIRNFIPEAHKDMLSDASYPLDYFLDELNAIDFSKGCYIGQEVTCRMYHRKSRRKLLCNTLLSSDLDYKPGAVLYLHGNKVGVMGSRVDNLGLALINTETLAVEPSALLSKPTLDDGIKIIAYKHCAE